jgi:hypothetical protein
MKKLLTWISSACCVVNATILAEACVTRIAGKSRVIVGKIRGHGLLLVGRPSVDVAESTS